jgi:transcriptional/translational regulatory protein YebC/TACO1
VDPEDLSSKARAFRDLGYDILEADTAWMPHPEAELRIEPDTLQAKKVSKVIEELDEEDDVTGIYSNTVLA